MNHQQDYRVTLSNVFEILLIAECQDKPEPIDRDNSMSFNLDHTKNQHLEPFEETNPRIVPDNRTYQEATMFGKKVWIIGDNHLSRMKRNIFKKSVNVGKTCFNVFKMSHLRDWLFTFYQHFTKNSLNIVVIYRFRWFNNEIKDKLNAEESRLVHVTLILAWRKTVIVVMKMTFKKHFPI